MQFTFLRNGYIKAFLCVCFLMVSSIGFSQSSWETSKKDGSGEIIVYYFNFEPFFYESEGGLKGIEYELLEAFKEFIDKKYGVKVSINYVPNPDFSGLYQSIKSGTSGEFGAASFSITKSRLKEVKFTLSYLPDIEVLISSYNVPVITDTSQFINTFQNLTALSIAGSTYEQNLNELSASLGFEIKQEYMSHFDEIATRISEEEDLYTYAQLSSYLLARQNGVQIRRQELFKKQNKGGYGIAYPTLSDWEEPINAFFTSPDFKSNINTIVRKYFGNDVNDLIQEIAAQDTSNRYQNIALLSKEYELQNAEIQKQNLELKTQALIRNSVIGGAVVVVILALLLLNRYQIKRRSNEQLTSKNKEIAKKKNELLAQTEELQQLNEAMVSQREFIEKQNEELKVRNVKINHSISAAKLIQEAMLPFESRLQESFEDFFVIYRPRDVVSGDFYWLRKDENTAYLAVVDCTGHGIPGAFMSMVGNSLLDKVIGLQKVPSLAEALQKMDVDIKFALKQELTGDVNGMDVSLVALEELANNKTRVRFAGAKRPLYYWETGTEDIQEVKGDKSSLGGNLRKNKVFTEKEQVLPKGSTIYLTSDGFVDQNDVDRKKIGAPKLKKLLQEIALLDMKNQKLKLESFLDNHQINTQQRDDILIWGVRL